MSTGVSSNLKIRSLEAMADCKMLYLSLRSWMGRKKRSEYWVNATSTPIVATLRTQWKGINFWRPKSTMTLMAGMLGGAVVADDDWHDIIVDGEARLAVQLAPNHVPPDWPNGVPQQMHLDLWPDDLDVAHELALALGARLLQASDTRTAPKGFQVYADPAGHPFCLCWG